jgi:hypothetical protein
MRRITKINIDESVNRHRLIFQESWVDKLDRLVIYFSFGVFLVYPVLTFINADFKNPNDKFISLTILPISILFGLYVIYRKATEKRLFKVITPFDKQTTRQMLLDFADEQELEIHRKSNDCLIFNESSDDFNSSHKKSMVFIVKDNLVLFTVLKDQFKLNLPTLTSHLLLRYNLKKLFGQPISTDKQNANDGNASL